MTRVRQLRPAAIVPPPMLQHDVIEALAKAVEAAAAVQCVIERSAQVLHQRPPNPPRRRRRPGHAPGAVCQVQVFVGRLTFWRRKSWACPEGDRTDGGLGQFRTRDFVDNLGPGTFSSASAICISPSVSALSGIRYVRLASPAWLVAGSSHARTWSTSRARRVRDPGLMRLAHNRFERRGQLTLEREGARVGKGDCPAPGSEVFFLSRR